MERENDAGHGGVAELCWTAVFGLLAGVMALVGWAVLGVLGYEAMVIPPLAGGLAGWGVWRLERDGNRVPTETPVPVHVRRLPPDLPREFS